MMLFGSLDYLWITRSRSEETPRLTSDNQPGPPLGSSSPTSSESTGAAGIQEHGDAIGRALNNPMGRRADDSYSMWLLLSIRPGDSRLSVIAYQLRIAWRNCKKNISMPS